MTRPPDFAVAYAGRLLIDAWIDATTRHWLRRAADFEWVLTGDRGATPTPAHLAARPDIAAIIQSCRARAALNDASRMQFTENDASWVQFIETLADVASHDQGDDRAA